MDTPVKTARCPRTLLLFGAVGLLAGYLGPIVLNPGANQGPLLGIFITGPLGVLLGAFACVLQRLVPAVSRGVLRGSAAAFGVVTLYYCLPEPALVGRVIEAQVEDCGSPDRLAGAALSQWEQALARTPWAHPQPDWKQAALRNVAHFEAAVLTVRITRSSAVYARRKPWDQGTRFAGPWAAEQRSASYYVPGHGGACADYQSGQSALYWPVPGPSEIAGPAEPWPPLDAAGFLSLQQLGPVPAEISALLPAAR